MKEAKLFGRRVRAIRKAARITQERIAEQAQINPKYLGELERGEKKPSFDALVALAEALHVSPADLFQFDREERDDKTLRKKIDSLLDRSTTDELNRIYRIAKVLKGP
jgi:transcriptional regulator with XRE-family HTH domain